MSLSLSIVRSSSAVWNVFIAGCLLFQFLTPAAFVHAKCPSHVSTSTPLHFSSLHHNLSSTVPAGESLKFMISGVAGSEEITKGTMAKLSIEVYGIVLNSEEFDFCARVPCPIPAGANFHYTTTKKLPVNVPQGVPLDMTVEFVKPGDKSSPNILGCIEAQVSVESAMLTSRFAFAESEVEHLFELWKKQFLVTGSSSTGIEIEAHEHDYRKSVFSKNLHKVASHNALEEETWEMAMNQFGHLTSEEFKSVYASGYKPRPVDSKQNANMLRVTEKKKMVKQRDVHIFRQTEELPPAINWVEKGAVTDVKNQGACGSCWSFATTGALEGAYFIKYGNLVSFSEQELVSCDHVDKGCGGGIMDSAYEWIENNGGICSEESYPYVSGGGKKPWCKKSSCTIIPNSAPSNFFDVSHDEPDLMSAVAKTPVAVAIEADETTFQFYSRGVLTAKCGNKLDHGVLVVGYGTEDGKDYWLVKNSWGPMWGDKGFIKLERGATLEGGECGILLSPSYPVY